VLANFELWRHPVRMAQFVFDPVRVAAFSLLLLGIGAAFIAVRSEPPV